MIALKQISLSDPFFRVLDEVGLVDCCVVSVSTIWTLALVSSFALRVGFAVEKSIRQIDYRSGSFVAQETSPPGYSFQADCWLGWEL